LIVGLFVVVYMISKKDDAASKPGAASDATAPSTATTVDEKND
jgi:hypothetical protein